MTYRDCSPSSRDLLSSVHVLSKLDSVNTPLDQNNHWAFGRGDRVDHFHIMRPLGQGGMAQVYLARDTKLGRKVALKIVRTEALETQKARERFLFEARATARFSHPSIVTIYAVGEVDQNPYVALEYLKGTTLRQHMQQNRISAKEVIRIGRAVTQALVVAHADHIYHRDLKPENIMLCNDGRVCVLDFGLASVLAHDPSALKEPGSTVSLPAVASKH